MNPATIKPLDLPSVMLANKNKLPDTPSIYFAIDAQNTIQYIGRTVNLRQRIASHHRKWDFNQLAGCRISYMNCDPALLDEVETALIGWFDPPLNGLIVKPESKLNPPFIRWKLRTVMADRKISNAELGDAIGKHETTVSRLRQRDTLPAIGNEEIEKIRQAITSLSSEFADCKLEDLVELIEDD